MHLYVLAAAAMATSFVIFSHQRRPCPAQQFSSASECMRVQVSSGFR